MADKPETKSKLDELVKRLASNKIGQDELLEELTAVVGQVGALETANHRFREDMRGHARAEWSRYMAAAIKGMCGVEMIALDFEDHQRDEMVLACESIAEKALERWRLRWVEGIIPTRRRKRSESDDKPTVDEKPATPEQTKQFVAEIEANLGLQKPPDDSALWGPETDKKYPWQKSAPKPQMAVAESPKPADSPKPAPEPAKAPAPPPPKQEPAKPPMALTTSRPEPPRPTTAAAPKPEAPKPSPVPSPSTPPPGRPAPSPPPPAPRAPSPPRERQPGDDD